MKKYADQYVDELEIYFPEIEKRSYAEWLKLNWGLSSYMSNRGVHHTVKEIFSGKW
jgi:hypothetical protein